MNGVHSVNEGSRTALCFNSASSSSKTQAKCEGSFTTGAPCIEHNSMPSVSRTKMEEMYKYQRIMGSNA